MNFPRIVHLIYFPWHTNGKLKEDENDFDHTFYNNFKIKNKNWDVKLWTLSKTKKFINEHYKDTWNKIWNLATHPTQAVDFFRLLITYHFGGIYWQYGSTQLLPLEFFMPLNGKKIKLFVETIISKQFSIIQSRRPIRRGKLEELVRISFGCFSAYPKNSFLNYCMVKSLYNLKKYKVNEIYDIYYIGANAMISEAFAECHNKKDMILEYNTNRFIKFHSMGSWKLNSYQKINSIP